MPLSYPLALVLGDGEVDNRIVRLLKAWIGTLQPIEDTLQAMLAQKDVNQAEGAQLDILGRLVGQGRDGLSDADLRRFIRARIATNKSSGTAENLIRVATLVVSDNSAVYTVTDEGTATVRLLVDDIVLGDATATILLKFAGQAKSAGVRLVLQWFDSAKSGAFRFDGGPGFDVGHLSADADV